MAKVKELDGDVEGVVNADEEREQEHATGVTDEQIAVRAYQLWEQDGRQEGTAELNWSRAKHELSH